MKQPAKVEIIENKLHLLDWSSFLDFKESISTMVTEPIDFSKVNQLIISGSYLDSFSFLEFFPKLKQLGFLACFSENWSELKGNVNINSLRLHNLKEKKKYLSSLNFILSFPNLEYLYVNMIGINNFNELQYLKKLHTIFAQCRNENDIKLPFDFSTLEFLPNLKLLSVWSAVDKHRIPVENLVPVLKNPSITSIEITQMYSTEDKKLKKLIDEIKPSLFQTNLSTNEIHLINQNNFAW